MQMMTNRYVKTHEIIIFYLVTPTESQTEERTEIRTV
jgi:hypothetical protein